MIQLFRYLGKLGEFIAFIKEFIVFWKEIKNLLQERNLTASNSDTAEVDSKILSLIAKGDELHLKAQMLL